MKNLKQLIDLAHEAVPKITCEEFASNQEKFLIIDVREGSEIIETGIIEGATNIPRGLLEFKLQPDPEVMAEDTPILVYCGGGSRASLAGKTLQELGFTNVKNLEGGFREWKDFHSF